ncbi:HPP family protein [Cognatilysobacter bugurensis]|uniref:HPP family protein n=1 Tax=Cognatilysobacter bugurensis TaxID=543356 RepID=UPI001E30E19C|nr:HPP family protein [Lysobacter bugurensis]
MVPSRLFLLFRPILAGANARDRLVACLGALFGIALTAAVTSATPGLVLAVPMGATAVLLFAVPSSPLAQPWPVIGGNTVSAVVGLLVGALVPDERLAAGAAVACAIAVMSLLRCLHPPGGAVALLVATGGAAASGLWFPAVVAANCLVLVGAGWLFHRVSGHSYPHRAALAAAPEPFGVTADDIDRALEDVDEAFDISRADLVALLERAEAHAAQRRRLM